MVGRLRERSDSLPLDGNSASKHEGNRLTQELSLSKQCLKICQKASEEVVWQVEHTVREAIADEDSNIVAAAATQWTVLAEKISTIVYNTTKISIHLLYPKFLITLRWFYS